MPPTTYNRYPKHPFTVSAAKKDVPSACKTLWENLRKCEQRQYPHQSNCFPQRAIFRLCLRATTFGSAH